MALRALCCCVHACLCAWLPSCGSGSVDTTRLTLDDATHTSHTQTVLSRIKSTTGINKITKAMEMVAASKMRGDEDRLKNGRPFQVRFPFSSFLHNHLSV